MKQKLLDTLELPAGLKELSNDELTTVAHELRDELIEVMSTCSGHFASSLGATELTVAAHATFNTPHDRLVWDVGHQGYIHKMLTGRRDKLSTIRQEGGISGYLKRTESEYDAFGAGHAGTSISAAAGMAKALNDSSEKRYVVPIIGDGSLTSGMAFEALNHAGALGLPNLICILNDNEMSISPNVGALSWLFSSTVTSKTSSSMRRQFKNLHKQGYVPDFVYRAIDRAEEAAQGYFAPASLLFEAFGFRYIGPVDGHSIADLMKALEHAKNQDVPVLIHTHTVKGKGYDAAENDPLTWHAVKPFNRSKATFLSAAQKKKSVPTYSKVFAQTLTEFARADKDIVAITAAMPTGTGLDAFEKELPDQFIDVGICEQHAVTFAAGLACEGKKPVCAIYSTFLQRAYDQIVHDVCIQNLPVIFALDRAGVVGDDGETHQGVFDITYLRSLPNMTVMAPKDEGELRSMIATALDHSSGPIAFRYPRGNGVGVDLSEPITALPFGKSEVVQSGSDILFLCIGPTTYTGVEVAERLNESIGVTSTVINARFIKPLDKALLEQELERYPIICTIEDHALAGGFGSAVLEFIHDSCITMQSPLMRFGIQDNFVTHAKPEVQHDTNGCSASKIYEKLSLILKPQRRVALRDR